MSSLLSENLWRGQWRPTHSIGAAGGINIDASRIGYAENEPDSGANFYRNRDLAMPENRMNYFGGDGLVVKSIPSKVGRWPANLVLSHMTGCKLVGYAPGMKNVGTGKMVSEGPHLTHGKGLGGRSTASVPETVESWACVDGCPVAALDNQTGDLPGATSFSRPAKYNATSYTVGDAPLQPGYNDSGRASRFFKVVKP